MNQSEKIQLRVLRSTAITATKQSERADAVSAIINMYEREIENLKLRLNVLQQQQQN